MEVVASGLKFARGDRFQLSVPDLRIGTGHTTAVFGANGCGKTTLLRLMGGLEQPQAGSLTLGGEDAVTVAPARVGYAFQEAVFLSGTVRRNLALALELRGVEPAAARRRIEEAAEATGVAGLLDADARRLSGGEGKRVSLARTLALRASLTLLDEPMAQLDGAIRLRLLDDLPDLLARFTESTILVTHDLGEAARLADRLLVLIDGEVRAHGDTATLLRRPSDPDVAVLLGFFVVETGAGPTAIHPRGLRVGDGSLRLEMQVRRVVDLGSTREVVGSIAGTRVTVTLPDGYAAPEPGAALSVATDDAVTL